MIDTHKIFKRLTEAGVSEAESKALLETACELGDSSARADLHKELRAQTWRFFGIVALMTAILLGGIHWQLDGLKRDIREIRNTINARQNED